MNWWFVSFCAPDEFLGGCYVEGTDKVDAFLRCNELGLNPGGFAEIAGPIPREVMNVRTLPEHRNRILMPFEGEGAS